MARRPPSNETGQVQTTTRRWLRHPPNPKILGFSKNGSLHMADIFILTCATHQVGATTNKFPSDRPTHRPFTRSALGTFNHSKRGHRVQCNHRSLSFFNNHNATSRQRSLAASFARRVYTRKLDRTTFDHCLHLLSLGCAHRHVK